MDRIPRHPSHPSYRKHRRQIIWQIILPIILAFLLLIGAAYLVVRSTFGAGGDVARWAAISTMWLSLPVMFAALIMLALMIGVTYLLGRLAGFIPPYSFIGQTYADKMLAAARAAEATAHRPLTIFSRLGWLARTGLRRLRGG